MSFKGKKFTQEKSEQPVMLRCVDIWQGGSRTLGKGTKKRIDGERRKQKGKGETVRSLKQQIRIIKTCGEKGTEKLVSEHGEKGLKQHSVPEGVETLRRLCLCSGLSKS